jgi:lysophospholipase L1-like esterase
MIRVARRWLASAAVFLVAGEMLGRWLDIVDRMNGYPRRLYLATGLPDLPYRLRPGVEARVGDVHVRINRLGLRGPEIAPTPPPGRRRLLVLGDSVVFGAGLDDADGFAHRLEAELAQRGDARTEVLNGGAPGYNTEAELAFLREVGLGLGPTHLLLGVSLNDFGPAPVLDASGVLTSRPRERSRFPWLTNHSELYTCLVWLAGYLRGTHWWQGLGDGDQWRGLDATIAAMHKRFYATPGGPGWERVRTALTGLRDLARARALELLVVIFPERDQVGTPAPNLDPQRAWLDLCAALGLACLDLHAAFAAGEGELFQDTQHPNAAGMRTAARAVAARLVP